MADYTAKWRIQGENGMQAAFRSMLGDAKSTADRMSGVFKTAFAGISVAAIISAGKAAAAFGDEMQKAAKRTGLGAGEFASLAGAAKLADVELGTLSKGLRTMMIAQSEATTGNKKALEAFAALGIELESFRKLDARQQLEDIADRLVALRDPADRARAGSQLFGRAWEELAPFLLEGAAGIRSATDEYERFNGKLSNEQLQRLADADQAIKNLKSSFTGLARTLTAEVAPGLSQFFNNVNAIVSGDAIGKLREQIDFLQRMQGRSFVSAGYGAVGSGFFTPEEGAAKLKELQAQLAALERSNRGTPPGGRDRRPFVPGFEDEGAKDKAAADAERAAKAAAKAAADALKAQADAYRDIYTAGMQAIEGLRTPVEDQIAQYHEAKFALEELARTYPNLADQAQAALKRLEADGLEDIKITAEKIFPKREVNQLSVFADEAARNIQDSFAAFLFDPFEGGLRGMVKGFADALRQMLAQAAAAQIFDFLGSFTGSSNAFVAGISGFFKRAGGRATGGDVKAGQAYMVGENRRPEWFIPGVSGTVLAAGGIGGGISVTVAPVYNMDNRGATQELIKQLPAIMEQNKRETVALAVAAVRDNVKRRGRV